MTFHQRMLAVLALGLLVALPVRAHEGHDHGAPAAPVTQTVLPRFAVTGEEFELVGVVAGSELVLYLDETASNAPIDGASIEVDAAGTSVVAAPAGVGVYRMPVGKLAQPGSHPLTITIEAGERLDLLSATLDIAAPAAVASAQPSGKTAAGLAATAPWWWYGAPILLLAVGGFAWSRRRGAQS